MIATWSEGKDLQHCDVRPGEPGIDTDQGHEASNEQACGHQDHESERDFGHDQDRHQPAAIGARGADRSLGESLSERRVRDADRRPQADEDRRQRGGRQRKDDEAAIEGELAELRHGRRPRGNEGVDRHARQCQSRAAREKREDETFDQRLPDEPPPVCADRGAHRELALTIRGSRQ
jgi:hypothetical protein